MSCYAEVDEAGTVVQVIVADAAFIATRPGTWLPTPEPGERGYPGPGHTWDADLGAFVAPQPFPSWTLNPKTLTWDAPVRLDAKPGVAYSWNEKLQTWQPR